MLNDTDLSIKKKKKKNTEMSSPFDQLLAKPSINLEKKRMDTNERNIVVKDE